jgi:glucose/arabinose dehydrogenase
VIALLLLASLRVADATPRLEPVVSGLAQPVAIAHAGDARLFVAEQTGRVRVVAGTTVLAAPFLDLSGLVSCCGEQGLLGLAFHPDYATNGFFFVSYTDAAGDSVVARYQVSAADPDRADPASGRILLTVPQPYANHNGGHIAFGRDGYLYLALGDGGSGGDPHGNGQNLGTLLGKLLRLEPLLGPDPPYYAVPADNPFVDGDPATRDEIWAYGLRNPWRFSFDRLTGDLFIGDVGQGCYEEIDFQPASSRGGENYGWRVAEGPVCFDSGSCRFAGCSFQGLTRPILTYPHVGAGCGGAVTGGYRYRGAGVPELAGTYLFADYCTGEVWGAVPDAGGQWTATLLFDTGYAVSTFGEDRNGEVYLADLVTGTLYRLAGAPAGPFGDAFDDGSAADWVVVRGRWEVAGGALQNRGTGKAEILAPFAGCGVCAVEAQLWAASEDARACLLGWYQDARNYVELRMNPRADRWQFRQVAGGKTVASATAPWRLRSRTPYRARVVFDGTDFRVSVDGTPVLSVAPGAPPAGRVGFRAQGARARFDEIAVE